MMPSTQQEWDASNYRYSRSHATAELLDSIAGIAPQIPEGRKWFGPRPWQEALRCGETFRHALRVYAVDVRPEVTCPKCRALMRAIRPQSAPFFDVIPCHVGRVYVVGGEFVTRAQYEERVIR